MVTALKATQATKIDSFGDWAMVHCQVITPGTVRIAKTADELQSAGPGGALQGLAITPEMGPRSLQWHGDLWAIADVDGVAVDFQPHRGRC